MTDTVDLVLTDSWEMKVSAGVNFLAQPINCDIGIAVMDANTTPSGITGFKIYQSGNDQAASRTVVGSGYVFLRAYRPSPGITPVCAFRTWTD